MPAVYSLLGTDRLIKLAPDQLERLSDSITAELNYNPEIRRVLQECAERALNLILEHDERVRGGR